MQASSVVLTPCYGARSVLGLPETVHTLSQVAWRASRQLFCNRETDDLTA